MWCGYWGAASSSPTNGFREFSYSAHSSAEEFLSIPVCLGISAYLFVCILRGLCVSALSPSPGVGRLVLLSWSMCPYASKETQMDSVESLPNSGPRFPNMAAQSWVPESHRPLPLQTGCCGPGITLLSPGRSLLHFFSLKQETLLGRRQMKPVIRKFAKCVCESSEVSREPHTAEDLMKPSLLCGRPINL